MARKKRKYVRRKPLRQDTMPVSPLFIGLVPFLFLLSLASGYIIMQYRPPLVIPADIFDFHLPEITFSVSEVMAVFSLAGGKMGEQAGGVYNAVVSFSVNTVQMSILTIQAVFHATSQSVIEYTQSFLWTMQDFWKYLDIPGKITEFSSAILWPLHFLDPKPLLQTTATKTEESKAGLAQLFSPIMPFLSYAWEVFKQTLVMLWEGCKELFAFIAYMIQSSN